MTILGIIAKPRKSLQGFNKNSLVRRRSKRRKKTVKRLSKAYRKVRNQRNDYLHQWSRRLVNTYEAIVFEELAPSKMSKAPKPKQDEDGKHLPNGAAVKAGLNKSILDAGWATFIALCEYKLRMLV